MIKEDCRVHIRAAEPEDAPELLKIYAPYVKNTAITFEYEVPSLDEFRERVIQTLKKYPYLTAEMNGEIVGYAYTGPFVGRAACSWSVETSIYVKENARGLGIGRMLYEKLEEISAMQNIVHMDACIAWPEREDSCLTQNSVKFHSHMGYRLVGEFHKCGYKFQKWYSLVWMEKVIGSHDQAPEPFVPFDKIKDKI